MNARDHAIDFYSRFIQKVIPCNTLEVAETAKLLENTFRLVNISLINELSKFCNEIGIEVKEVIEAASTKPYGFMKFSPGLGAGGHCIPIDPMYLSNKAKSIGSKFSLIDISAEINASMPNYFVARAEKILGKLNKKRILVVGVAYKPNVADIRESPAIRLIKALREKGADVSWHDNLVKNINGENSVYINGDYDLAILATVHSSMNIGDLGDIPILDTRISLP
jgi:UDP-N-acetyl-D-glucosamine dehydrogenase